MPEGDTVWNTAAQLGAAIGGAELLRTDFRVPSLATVDLAGWHVTASTSRGKHLLLRLHPPQRAGAGTRELTLHSHLRMDGAWRTYPPGESWRGRPAHTVRVVLHTARAVAVGYHLHEVSLIPTEQEPRLVGHLGPDLLGPDWDPQEAVRRLSAQPDRPIADALLDQRNLAGIGNLYKCEVLFLRGVSPWTPTGQVANLPDLVGLAQRLLGANRGRWAQSTTGSLRQGGTTYVYGRRAKPCRRCGTLIRKAEQGDRVTYWCPVCQPAAG